MSGTLQIVLPFVTALAVLGVFHAVAYLHMRLTDLDQVDEDRDPKLLRS